MFSDVDHHVGESSGCQVLQQHFGRIIQTQLLSGESVVFISRLFQENTHYLKTPESTIISCSMYCLWGLIAQ
jgi:hypothetical protein